MILKYLIEKEIKQFRRNRFLPQLLIMYPLMIMLVFPWAVDMEIKNLNLTVIDRDQSDYSMRLIKKTSSSGYFREISSVYSYEAGLKEIEKGNADLLLDIPVDFAKEIQNDKRAEVSVIANTVNGTKGALGSSYLSMIVTDFNEDLIAEQGGDIIAPVQIFVQNRFNPYLDYKRFMIPALMVIVVTLICGFLPALNIVGEKESGTIEQINVSPVPKILFILSKLIPYWVLGVLLLTICVALGKLIYDLYPAGSLLTLYGYTFLFILVISGFGLIISDKSDTFQQAMFMMFFFLIVFILMSGLFTPVNSMPRWAQVLTWFNPLRYFISIMRSIYLRGSSFVELLPDGIPLLIFAVVFNMWAMFSYRKNR